MISSLMTRVRQVVAEVNQVVDLLGLLWLGSFAGLFWLSFVYDSLLLRLIAVVIFAWPIVAMVVEVFANATADDEKL